MQIGPTRPGRAVLVVGALIVAGCGSGAHKTSSGPTTDISTVTLPSGSAATTSSTSPTSSTGSSASSSTLATPAPSGPLAVQDSISLPIPAGGPVAAEAPNGAVFVADQPGGQVWVVDGDGPPAVAEHVSGTINSLATDISNLYIANFTTLYQYDRTTGSLTAQYKLPPVSQADISDDLPVHISDVGGTVWVMITQGNDVDVYLLDPGTRALLEEEVSLGAAVGTDGTLFYERSDGHLVSRSSSGETIVGPALSTRSNGEGGGIQYLDAVSGGYLWTEDDAGQGLDAEYQGYATGTLAAGPQISGTVNASMADTLAGALWLSGAESSQCPTGDDACVLRLGTGGSLTDGFNVSAGSVLLGTYPAIVGPSGTHLILERLS